MKLRAVKDGSLNAVKEGNIYSIDKNTSSRPSQNVIKALKEMAKAYLSK